MRHRAAPRQSHASLLQRHHRSAAAPHHAPHNRFHSLAEHQAMYDEGDDVARREAIDTEEQNYQELSQAEKRHTARVEALREDEVEEDDYFESKHHKPAAHHKKAAKHGKKHRSHKQHRKQPHHAGKPAHHQQEAQPVHHAAHTVMSADQAADRGNYETKNEGKHSSEEFTKGRFDSSESLAEHRGHKHHGHRSGATADSRQQKEPLTKEQEEAEAEATYEAEKAKSDMEENAKKQAATVKQHQLEYEDRVANAN